MKAIQVRKRGKTGTTIHWLHNPKRTYCGRNPADLDIIATLELEQLPAVEACHNCARIQADTPGNLPLM